MIRPPIVLAALLLVPTTAYAERPTEGGLWSFDPGDVVLTHDDPNGFVRVHYTVAGDHAVPAADADADGVPDYVTQVGATVDEVFNSYDQLGVRLPVAEAELGLGPLGGSAAFDVYLVDFAGNADGTFLVDACDGAPPRCAGAFVMENDFKGYGYQSKTEAIDTVTSHELFHAVQAAYVPALPVWVSEGLATWAERQFRTDSRDFRRLCDFYLKDTTRSLFKPPAGPVPAFAYGTALWFDFLSGRHDASIADEILSAAIDDPEVVASFGQILADRDDELAAAFSTFATWNLATGELAGAADSHPYAAELVGVLAEDAGPQLEDDTRIFSLSATYYLLQHPGGPLWFGLAAPVAPVTFGLHQVEGGAVLPALGLAWHDTASAHELADLPAGDYWLTVTHPTLADKSTKIHFCLGDEAHATLCAPATETGETGETDESSETGVDETTGDASTGAPEPTDPTEPAEPASEGSEGETGAEAAPPTETGCGCRTTSSPAWAGLLLLAVVRRRRQPHT